MTDVDTAPDPRRSVATMPDRSPIALFPVRLETRFVTASDRGKPVAIDQAANPTAAAPATGHQLWIRIFPDDCSIDTFEAGLSVSELAAVQRYWQAIWSAGGLTDGEQGAWTALVAAVGSGRAGWLVDTYQPTNLAAAPSKAAATDEILVIATQTPSSDLDAAALAAYWVSVWQAAGDATATQQAMVTLQAAVGSADAATLVAQYVPANLSDAPTPPDTTTSVAVQTAFLVFGPDPATTPQSWATAPRVECFPDRFIALGYEGTEQTVAQLGSPVTLPLYVGPDPSADPSESIHPNGADLFVPAQLEWMVDFDAAVAAGMGIIVDLTDAQAQEGFDRLIVLGLQSGVSDTDGATALAQLLTHHATGRAGLSLVSQGTPTHNSGGPTTGYTRLDDAAESFADRQAAPLFTATTDVNAKSDGQWLAELLGIDPTALTSIHGAGGTDQALARAMQRALWPATLGYWMDTLLTPVFGDTTIDEARAFFTAYVSGRGAVPALAVGAQPYGILPTTAFSRLSYTQGRGRLDPALAFRAGLLAVSRAIDGDWTTMSDAAAHVGQAGDAQQTLLDIIGLHPGTVEYWSRYAESLEQLFHTASLLGLGAQIATELSQLTLQAEGAALLVKLGYDGGAWPDIMNHFFLLDARQISTVIDDRPLSETDPIRAYTDARENYISWLIAAAKTSLDALRLEQGFTADTTPQALLYLQLRHALMLGYYRASYRLHLSAGLISDAQRPAWVHEAPFIHVAEAAAGTSESRFAQLYVTAPTITGSPDQLIADYITAQYPTLSEAADFADQLSALAVLADAPTAALERVFAEHIDTASYRFDSWQLGLVAAQLQEMRYDANGTAQLGVYLGAYAWLENLTPSTAVLTPVQLPTDLQDGFADPAPLQSDSTNGGYIHAPSLPHARTAAVLRSGYLANATPANPQTMSVNLSSDRVRLALSILEGIREGQSLGALLGYRFERGLHDAWATAEVDSYIYPLRKAFPLVADALVSTQTAPDVPIEAIEASNVLDGRKLAGQMQSSGVSTYPFGLAAGTLPAASSAAAEAIDGQAAALLDLHDAIADLALAEGVHQAVQGNFTRVAATLDAYSSGTFPPDPEVVQTPAPGSALTHRVAMHLTPGLSAPAGATPRGVAEPALDAWLAQTLPPLTQIGCAVSYTDPVSGTAETLPVTLADLGLRPLDLLGLITVEAGQAMSELDDRVLRVALTTAAPRPDAQLTIAYMTAPAGALSVFEAAPLFSGLSALVHGARPLQATDVMLHGDASLQDNAAIVVYRDRIAAPLADLTALGADITTMLATLAPVLADTTTNLATIVSGIDGYLDTAVGLLERAARFGVPQSGWGFAYAWKAQTLGSLLADVAAVTIRWTGRLAQFDAAVAAYDALPAATSDVDRFQALAAAEVLTVGTLAALPADPATLRGQLDTMRAAFVARQDELTALQTQPFTTVAAAIAAVQALLPLTAFDSQPFTVDTTQDSCVSAAQDVQQILTGLGAAVSDRTTATTAQLTAFDAAADPATQAQTLQTAATALFGSDFSLVPEFTPAASQAAAWNSAYQDGASGALVSYLTSTAGLDFPVDEWVGGVARVRTAVGRWEQVAALAQALGGGSLELVPAQFPYQSGDAWVAMTLPPDYALDSDRLCYTASYPAPFDTTANQCGLLLDEWTEVVPSATRDTGLTFNFARPDNEPPQAILLVTPASSSGSWLWEDLVGAVNETLDLAKKRAVEPAQLDATGYARLLPATVSAATSYGISIATVLAAADGVIARLEESAHV
jgi:hypothetical protein